VTCKIARSTTYLDDLLAGLDVEEAGVELVEPGF
jgi:hypothetical protein